MIKINLSHGFYITISKGIEYTLCHAREVIPEVVKDCNVDMKKVTTQLVGYYTTFEHAIKRYLCCVQDIENNSEKESVEQYAEYVDQIDSLAVQIITNIAKENGLLEMISRDRDGRKDGIKSD